MNILDFDSVIVIRKKKNPAPDRAGLAGGVVTPCQLVKKK